MDGLRLAPASGGKARHLVVLLHGVGADAQDLFGLAPEWAASAPDAAFVAIDAPDLYEGAPFGRQWFPLNDRRPAVLTAAIRAAAPPLETRLAALLAADAVSNGALVLMGFSQGAMMALQAGLRRAAPPAGIMAFSGALLDPPAPRAAHWPPVLLVHGREDEVVPAAASAQAESALRALGVPVTSRFVPGLGHGIEDTGLSAGADFLRRVTTP